MISPEKKAKELVDKIYYDIDFDLVGMPNTKKMVAKQCALIAVDENLKMLKTMLDESTEIYQSLNTPKKLCVDLLNPLLKFWNEVKDEVVNYEKV